MGLWSENFKSKVVNTLWFLFYFEKYYFFVLPQVQGRVHVGRDVDQLFGEAVVQSKARVSPEFVRCGGTERRMLCENRSKDNS